MTRFVDDFSVLAVEKCVMEPLVDIFSYRAVADMTDDVIEDIAREDEVTMAERHRLETKLVVLERSLSHLQQLEKYSMKGRSNGNHLAN